MDGYGVLGISTNSLGVVGSSSNSSGVQGFSSSSYGVVGVSGSSSYTGVYGTNNNADGVVGVTSSASAAGIRGQNSGGGYAGYFSGNLFSSGNIVLEAGGNPRLYTASLSGEQNRYLTLLNSPSSPSASGLKAGGVLIRMTTVC